MVRQLPPRPTEPAPSPQPVVRPRWQLWTAGAVAAVSFVAAVVFGVHAHSADRQLQQAQQQVDDLTAVLSAPDAKVASASAGGGNVSAIVSHRLAKIVFTARGMPALPGDQRYQLWLIGAPGGPHSPGVLSAGANPPPLLGNLANGQSKVGVTVEPAGGSIAPTSPLVMEFDLPA